MPLNYLPIRNRIRQYQQKPSKATEERLENEILLLQLQLAERLPQITSIENFEWSDGNEDLSWRTVLALLRKNEFSIDTFLGCVIDTLNERDLLPDDGIRSESL